MTNRQNRAMGLYNEFVECTQDLPLDIQRSVTQMRNFDLEFQQVMTKVNKLTETLKGNVSSANVEKLKNLLVTGLDIGDRKVLTMEKTYELVEDKLMRLENSNKAYLTSIKEEPEDQKPRMKDKQKISSCPKERGLPSTSTSTATNELKNRSTDNEPNNGIDISKRLQPNRADEPDFKEISDDIVVISALNHPTPLPRATATAQIQSQLKFKQNAQKKEKPTIKKSKYKKKRKDTSPSTEDFEGTPVDFKKPTKKKRKYKKKQKDNSPSTDDDEEIRVEIEKLTKKKRKCKKKQNYNSSSPDDTEEIPIDPGEPTYCLCNQISYGQMICCDNYLCTLEWFHFSCVSLLTKPKGKWFCPNCRGDRSNTMKPKAQFLKELERYNKEKEDKA